MGTPSGTTPTKKKKKAHSVLATAFENCPDILRVDWETYVRIRIGQCSLTLDSFVWILSGEGMLL